MAGYSIWAYHTHYARDCGLNGESEKKSPRRDGIDRLVAEADGPQ